VKIFTLIVLLILSTKAFSEELKKSTDDSLAYILSTMSVLYKSTGYPIVELIQSWEQISECGGTWQSCPNARLFITSSMGDLYETPLLYELPKAKGWRFIHAAETEHELVLTLFTTLQHANVSAQSRKEWPFKKYTLRVSKYDGTITVEK